MKLTFSRWVHRKEKDVVAELENMGIETDTIADLLVKENNSKDLRVACELGYEPFAIANELASRISN